MRTLSKTLTAGFTLREADKQSLMASLELSSDMDLAQYLQPKESDYIMVPVRALSATGVQGNMFNFGFAGGGALRNAVDKFNNLVVLKDHSMSVDDWLGTTEQAYWDNSTDIPPGVNVMLKVDKKADPKTARGLMSGALNSVSVTVAFDFEPSHPDMDEFDFLMNLGQEVDGKTVQANITNIKRLHEISVVWSGADVYAKTTNGNGQKPLSQSLNLAIDAPAPTTQKEKAVDWKKLAVLIGLSMENPTEDDVNRGLTALMASATVSKTELATVKTELAASQGQVVDLNANLAQKTVEVTTLSTEITALKAEKTALEGKVALGVQFLEKQRTEAARLYALVEAKDANPAMLEMLKNCDLTIAESFIASYAKRAEQIAPLVCSKCSTSMKGAEASRRASHQSTDTPENQPVTAQDARLTRAVTSIHG